MEKTCLTSLEMAAFLLWVVWFFFGGRGEMGGRGSLNSLPYVDLNLQGVVWVVLKAGN